MRFPIQLRWSDLHVSEQQREYINLAILAAVVGLGAGIIAVLFRLLIVWVTTNGLEAVGEHLSALGRARFALIPALGGLIAGPLIYYGAREAKGHGVPEVIDAITRLGGRLRLRVIVVKALASALIIGTGGSSGREGPIVHMGSAMGSNLAQRLHLRTAHIKILLGCGAAGGISATFNTPIAGVLFAIELILMEFKTRSFIPLVISSVFARLMAPLFEGWVTGTHPGHLWQANPAFNVPEITLGDPGRELLAFLILGIICGLVAIVYIKLLYGMEDVFDRLRMKPWLKPALGGLLLGALGIAFVTFDGGAVKSLGIYGVGYDQIDTVLNTQISSRDWMLIATLAVMALAKVLAVSLTLGSGGSGGIFAPALFIGCMTGAAYGGVAHGLLGGGTADPVAYALVGMAALVAASTRGTLTAILMIFEMTQEYGMILPLLFACVIADMVGALGSPDTIYTKKLSRRGINIVQDLAPNVMQLFSVADVMVPREDVVTIKPDDQLHKLVSIIRRTGHNGFPVIDGHGNLVGVVTHEDTRRAHNEGELFAKAEDLMTRDLVTVTPRDTGETALRKMGDRRVSHLPVVDPDDPQLLLGWLSKGDVVFAYDDYHRRMEEPLCDDAEPTTVCEPGMDEVPAPKASTRVPQPLLRRLFGRRPREPLPWASGEDLEELVVEEDAPGEAEEAIEVEGEPPARTGEL